MNLQSMGVANKDFVMSSKKESGKKTTVQVLQSISDYGPDRPEPFAGFGHALIIGEARSGKSKEFSDRLAAMTKTD